MKSHLGLFFFVAALVAPLIVIAQQPAKPASPNPAPHPAASPATAGSVVDGTYRNPFFNFSYRLPFGWVDRTEAMQEGSEPGKSMVLLAVFERPPEASGKTINSAVVIAAESVSSYPGLKTAADYFGPLTELTTGKGFKVENEPYSFAVGAKNLVRADFSRETNGLSMWQSSVVMLEKGYIVSATFIGGTEDEVDGLAQRLSFPPRRPKP